MESGIVLPLWLVRQLLRMYNEFWLMWNLLATHDFVDNNSRYCVAPMPTTAQLTKYWNVYLLCCSYRVLRISDNIDDMGLPQWDLALCLLLAWALIYLCLVRGIKSSGKAVYFTAIFPYLVLIVLLGRAVTLEGAMKGINYYIKPEWHLLKNASVSF